MSTHSNIDTPDSPGRSAIEDAARIPSVAPHLRGQRLERWKARLVAQLRRELDFNLATVQLAAKIEQVRLQQRLDSADRGARAEAGDARQRRAGHPVHAHRKNPGNRRAPALEEQVGGRNPQIPSQALALYHPSAHRPGPTEPAPG